MTTMKTSRIVGYDLARALAVFGMVAVNFKVVMCMGAEANAPTWLAGLVSSLEGRAAATFVVLAGVGLSLLSHKSRTQNDTERLAQERLAQERRTLWKRAFFLFVVGALYTPIWPADILHFYGVYIALAAFFLAAPLWRLWVCVVVPILAFVVLILVLDYEKGWDWETLSYDGLWSPAGAVRHLFFNGFHPAIPWVAFIFLGMIVGRLDMKSAAVRWRLFGWGAGVAIVAEGSSWALIRLLSSGASPADQEIVQALFGTEPMPPMPLYMAAGSGTACAVIAAAVAFGERYGEAAWVRPFIATGQLALTLYVAHVIVGMGTLESLGMLENQSLPTAVTAATIFCVAAVAFAHFWRQRFDRGPLEAIMRRLT